MADSKKTRTIQVILRPASLPLKIVVVLLLVCCIAALLSLMWAHKGILAETERLRTEAAAVEYANQVLEEKTGKPDSVANVQSIAQENLGLVNPDTVIINPVS